MSCPNESCDPLCRVSAVANGFGLYYDVEYIDICAAECP